ncbi:hypothetical protein E3N88_33356 [Mikania micrantha]|uniref:RING-CH-type domain-containing protein n=1 Tax=Mikania micrantha TaxID=192012 RepID=A0A5N6MB36_9ASTR|nr:hypothetical protein E3N88_33356 [Mikania micrantha]
MPTTSLHSSPPPLSRVQQRTRHYRRRQQLRIVRYAQSSARLDSSVAGDECGSSGIFSFNHSRMESSSDEIDLESGELEMKVHCKWKIEKLCRICHLNFEIGGGDQAEHDDGDGGCGGAIELGCNCKGDLGAAHKQCAETWFKNKGNLAFCGQDMIAYGESQGSKLDDWVLIRPHKMKDSFETPILEPRSRKTICPRVLGKCIN